MLLALSIVKCLDKTRKYTERNNKKIFRPFYSFLPDLRMDQIQRKATDGCCVLSG